MIILSRRDFVQLMEFLAGRALLNDAAPILGLFTQSNENPSSSSQSLPNPPPTPASPASSGGFDSVLGAISNYVGAATTQINNAAASLANQTYTFAVSNGVSVQGAFTGFSASVGTALSINFSTQDYQITNFTTTAPEVTGSALPAGSVGPSISIGAGDMSSFLGKSTSISGSILNFTFNDGYKGIGLTLPLGNSSASATEQSQTQSVGDVQSGNLNSDLQSVDNTLWNMSQDPISDWQNYR